MEKNPITQLSPNSFTFSLHKHKIPQAKEVRGEDFLKFGEKNDYFDFLIRLFNNSAKHNAIVTGKNQYIQGQGWDFDQENLDTSVIAETKAFIARANGRESLAEVSRKVGLDIELFNGYALQVIWNKARTKIAEVFHIDFSKLRVSEDGKTFFFADNWQLTGTKLKDPVDNGWKEMKAFNLGSKKEDREGIRIIYWTHYRPDQDRYPLPDYVGSLAYIEMDTEIANFHLNNIKNGFWASMMINFNNGIPKKEEREQTEKAMKKKFSGSERAGEIVINFSKDKEHAPTIDPILPPNHDKMFLQLNEQVQQEIFTGHKVTTPMLFGIRTPGQLGGRTELIEGFEAFRSTYVEPRQDISEELFNFITKVNGLGQRLFLIPTKPIDIAFSEATIVSNLSREEIRDHLRKQGIELDQEVDAAPAEFQLEEDQRILDMLTEMGVPASDYKVLKIIDTNFREMKDVIISEQALVIHRFVDVLDIQILKLLLEDPLISVVDMSDSLRRSVDDVQRVLTRLEAVRQIVVTQDITEDGEPVTKRALTEEGENTVEEDMETAEITIKYKYTGPIDSRNRPFCSRLLSQDKLFSRGEIERMSALALRSVWERRGGFYTNPVTNETTPYCRHVWTQQVVVKRD